MDYKLVFDTTGFLSNNQIAEILNAIQPIEVREHQQANTRLLLYVVFSAEQKVDVDWVNDRVQDIEFCTCIEVKRGV